MDNIHTENIMICPVPSIPEPELSQAYKNEGGSMCRVKDIFDIETYGRFFVVERQLKVKAHILFNLSAVMSLRH